jgi:serine/threonine-protein kinase
MAIIAATTVASVIYGLRARAREARELGQYVLGEPAGGGAMGSVHRAKHAFLRRPTAVKILAADRAGEAAIARFERHVQQTAELSHPNIVSIYDFGRSPDGAFYYATELLEGVDLQRVVEETGPQPPARVGHLLLQAADALAEAHRNGLVHGDLKAENLIVCRQPRRHDLVKIVDFGLAKEPVGEEATPAADIRSLGEIAWFLLTGAKPFEGVIDPALEPVVRACLATSAADRPASAEAVRAALAACAVGPWAAEDAELWWTHRKNTASEGRAPAEQRTLTMAPRGAV